jgi:pimeloyl-ACP methyl ester carboxylesterase
VKTETPTAGDGSPRIARLERAGLPGLAYCATEGRSPGIVFLGGFGSNMNGAKALAVEAAALSRGHAFLRLDYRGHGQSDGNFAEATIGDWLEDALCVFDRATSGPQIVIGSSMGGWIALLLALARPERIRGLIGIAAAADFTERLIWNTLSEANRERLLRDGVLMPPSPYGDPIPITLRLIEEGRRHLVLDGPVPFTGPVRLLHGQRDSDIPWSHAILTAEKLAGDDVRTILIKDGDHRLSRPQDIALLIETLDEMIRLSPG